MIEDFNTIKMGLNSITSPKIKPTPHKKVPVLFLIYAVPKTFLQTA